MAQASIRRQSRNAEATTEAAAPEVSKVLPRRGPSKKSGFFALVIVLAILGGLTTWWGLNQSGQVAVLTTTGSVQRGETIESSDLSTIHVGKDTQNVTAASNSDQIIGTKALVDLVPGTLVNDQNTGSEVNFSAGETVVGIGLADGAAPTRPLVAGDKVRIIFTPLEGQAVDGADFVEAVVESSTRSETSGAYVVDVRLQEDDAISAARWSAAGQAAIVLDGSDE